MPVNGLVPTSGIQKLARSEVGNLYPEGVVQQDVLRFEIPEDTKIVSDDLRTTERDARRQPTGE